MYSLVQAANVGPAGPYLSQSLSLDDNDEVLYAVFAKNAANPADTDVPQPMKGSALCMYKMSDIEAAFEAAVDGCLTIGNAYGLNYLENNQCPGSSRPPTDPDIYCNARIYKYADGITPVVSTAALELPDHLTSSIITSIELHHTVAFIGTTEGQLLKVHIESGSSARVYEQIQIPFDDDLKGFTTNPVKRDMKINDATGELYLLTEQKLIKMRVENCGQYTTCETCIGTDAGRDGDPYCGWCTLQRQCTRYHECPMQDMSSRWLSYNDPQCVEITDIAPYDSHPITVAEQQITLTVQQLPDLLSGQQYICHFDDVFSNLAVKSGDTLRCTTPPSNLIPEIMNGEDHSSMLLSVESTETGVNFVDQEFSFYECSTHKSCVSCAGSRWACDWCVFENRCTHESTSCSGQNEVIVTGLNNKDSSMDGPDLCLQLQVQGGEILVSTGVDRQIIVLTDNLPNNDQIKSFLCSLNIEGAKQSAEATRENDALTCEYNSYTYTADQQELNVSLTVEWTDINDQVHLLDDRHGFEVTLYKCESLRPDCSRCVFEETTREELGCVWCDGTCAVNDSAVCLMTSDMVTRDNGLNCPDPVILDIFPLTGPVNGNTALTLYGTDFGRRFNDIRAVTVGGRTCDLGGFEMYYNTGSSVTCLTRSNPDDQTLQELFLNVTGLNGDLQTGTGAVRFGYKVPSITSFSPGFGPAAGGTRITINGMALNTGRNIEAFIGDKACIVISTYDEEAVCISSMGSVGETGLLWMSFDGIVQQADQNYTFTNNPGITAVSPSSSIIAGGRTMIVRGTYLNTTQMASLAVTVATPVTPNPVEFVENCSVENDEMMSCLTPNIMSAVINSSLPQLNVTFGFIMDGVSDLLTWSVDNDVDLEFFPDPKYDKFKNELYEKTDETLTIEGNYIDSAITASEVIVYIGNATCPVIFITETTLYCDLPEEQPPAGDFKGQDKGRGLPVVVVVHSNLEFTIGYISYPMASIVISVVSIVIVTILIFVIIVLSIRLFRSRRRVNLLVLQKDFLAEIKKGFSQRKFDIFHLTSDLEVSGMPFVSHRDYATNMLFIGQEVRPTTTDEEYDEEALVEEAMMKFSELLGNKNFLLILIQTLDTGSRSKLSVKERQSIASLLTVTMVLNNNMDVLTHVLTTLMAQMIQDADSTNQELLLFSKTDSVLEKLLSNWVSLCLYDQLKNHTAYPLFVLYRAIKYRTEHGPIDAVTGQAEFSLNFENLLQEDLDFNILTLVVLNKEETIIKEVKVLDVDTISQVKEKILDAIHLNKPYSGRPSANQVSLVWHRGRNDRLVLTDKCVRPVDNKFCRINTLKDFEVPDEAEVTLVDKGQAAGVISSSGPMHQFEVEITNEYFTQEGQKDLHPAKEAESSFTEEGGYCIPSKGSVQQKIPPKKPLPGFPSKVPGSTQEKEYEGESPYDNDGFGDEEQNLEGVRDWHLTRGKESYSVEDHTTGQRGSTLCCVSSNEHSQWAAYRIPIQRVLLSKIIIQDYVDNMFQTILSVENAPKAIKFLFDFFDKQAQLCDTKSTDTEIKHAWKNNILPLRFWSNAIKHPNYVFDIQLSPAVEASMDMIGQLFHDAHDTKTGKHGQESSINKFLYSRERTKYQRLVRQYYKGVEESAPVTTQDLNAELQKASQNFTGLFSKLSTLKQLWDLLLVVLKTKDQSDQEHLGCLLKEVKETLSGGDAL